MITCSSIEPVELSSIPKPTPFVPTASLLLSFHPADPCSGCLSVLPLERRAPRLPDTGVARVPFIALRLLGQALPLAVRGHSFGGRGDGTTQG